MATLVSVRKKGTRPAHPMLPVWLKRIGNELRKCRGAEKQEAFADQLKISRAQLSIMERGTRVYTIEPMLEILSAHGEDPVESLLRISGKLTTLSSEQVRSIYTLAECLESGDENSRLILSVLKMAEDKKQRTQ